MPAFPWVHDPDRTLYNKVRSLVIYEFVSRFQPENQEAIHHLHPENIYSLRLQQGHPCFLQQKHLC